MALTVAERVRRYKARKRGEDIPYLKPGVQVGYKQSHEHVEKRKRWGAEHHAWKGDDVLPRSGRARASRRYALTPCVRCGDERSELHHRDRNTANADPSNIIVLCHLCHMREHKALRSA